MVFSISRSTITLGKVINSTILPPAKKKSRVEWTLILLGNQCRRRKPEFKPVVNLERDGHHQVIPAHDILQGSIPVTRPYIYIYIYIYIYMREREPEVISLGFRVVLMIWLDET